VTAEFGWPVLLPPAAAPLSGWVTVGAVFCDGLAGWGAVCGDGWASADGVPNTVTAMPRATAAVTAIVAV
jgi:hypothetical protein